VKVDLFRQLDEWGNHLEDNIDHVDVEEVLERAPKLWGDKPQRSVKPRWRRPVRYAGAAAVVLAVVFALPNVIGVDNRAGEFNAVSGEPNLTVGSGSERLNALSTTLAPAATSAPTTAVSTTRPQSGSTPAPDPTLAITFPGTSFAPGTTVPPVGNPPPNLGRDVIFVADLAVDTRDVSASVTAARAIAESRGGYVFGQELGGGATVMSLKVPAEFFQDTLDRLSELGTVRSARVTSQDVTERIVDIESQIRTSEASVARLQELLTEAGTVNAIARVEAELLQRETVLEQLRGQLRTLQDQVALSTIVLTFHEFVRTPRLELSLSVHAADDGTGEQCFTGEGPAPAEGERYVVCVDLTNTGNLPLTDIDIDGPADVVSSLAPVSGTRVTTLAPGERYLLWTTAVAAESRKEEVVVQAVPLDESGARLEEELLESRRLLLVNIRPDEIEFEPESEGLPSLGDALAAGWNLVTTAANGIAVAVAFAIPLLWIPLLLGLFVWWRRRRG